LGLSGYGASAAAPQARVAFGCGALGSRAQARDARFLLQVTTATSHFTQIEVVSASGRVIRRLARVGPDVTEVEVSPNGKLVAWFSAKGVVVERIDGSARRLVIGAGLFPEVANMFAWSADSKALLAVDPNGGLDIVSLATGAKRQIVKRQGSDIEALAWPRLNEIVFLRSGTSSARVVLADRHGSSQHTILRQSIDQTTNVGASASVSPNRECVNVIASFDSPGDASWVSFRTFNLVTGRETRVRPFDYDGVPIWSPDSRRLLTYVVAGPTGGHLTIVSPSGKAVGTIRKDWVTPAAWTQRAMYLLSGGLSWHKKANDLLAIRAGHRAVTVVFKLPKGRQILSAQPF
jgi:hypothetical protein